MKIGFIGDSDFTVAKTNLTDLIKLADSRMYQEKRACKKKVRQGLLQVLNNG